jgi:UDP-N-acetyl-2-amino-2-deoxyglucuronate dehydrogenase
VSATNKVFKFGVVGCGSIGPTHGAAIRQIPEEAELIAVADVIPDRAQAMAQKFDIKRVYSSFEQILADKDIDVVCICTPSGMHADMSIQAMEAGKHVVVEKPMEITLEACDRMIAASNKTGKTLTVISQHRFDAATQLVKEAIDTGKLGKILLADAHVKWWRTQEYYDSGDWRGTWKWDGGGALMNQGVHTVDVLQYLVGGVNKLWAQTRTGAHTKIEVEDIAVACLDFACGAVGTFTATTAAYKGHPVRIDIYGTEGSAIIEGDRLKSMVLKNGQVLAGEEAAAHAVSVARGGTASVKDEAAGRQQTAKQGATWGDAHRGQIQNFLNAIRTGTKPLIDGCAARKPVEIVLSFYKSQRSGQPVELGQK